jgi:ABC-type Fe3+ transport system permease subunit/DNA-binding beta-propeller fold protein YncE
VNEIEKGFTAEDAESTEKRLYLKLKNSVVSADSAVSFDTVSGRFLTAVSLVLWAMVIFVPLAILFVQAISLSSEFKVPSGIFASVFRSFALAAAIAAMAVLLGWVPGRLLGTCRSCKDLLLLLLLIPLVLPRYVLYYAWTLLLSPTTRLGIYLSSRAGLARFVGTFTSTSVLILWYWPLAALLLAQGWRNIDRQIWNCASLDADGFKRFRKITLPLLTRPLLLAFGACFVLSLSEFATFDLAGIRTVGTELAVLYELTGSEGALGRAAWPVVGAALILAIALGKSLCTWELPSAALGTVEFKAQGWRWIVLSGLVGISLIAPLVLLVSNVADMQALSQFFKLHFDELGWSLAIAGFAAVMAYFIAFGALRCPQLWCGTIGSGLSLVVRTTILLAMFVPASLVAASLIRMLAVCDAPSGLRQAWYLVSAGQAARFAGVALILLLLTRYPYERQLSEMASLDGASRPTAWWYVHLPHTWPVLVGTFILIVMFSVTELSATMVLLPAGLPNFAQRLVNQMHYARDQQVIASCLVLYGVFLVLAAVVVLLLRVMRMRRQTILMFFCVVVLGLFGCDNKPGASDSPRILDSFGRTGRGPGEFLYPRAITIVPEQAGAAGLSVVDKTGRIQRFTTSGKFLDEIKMPLTKAGYPTGLSIAPNGNLYVADTHYHRVVIFSDDGKFMSEFGRFGQEDGCFIYPTDVAFSGDGKIFVSEYGGNDRVSVFSEQGDFLFCFGSPGNEDGEFSRPSALCVDRVRKRLYVSDACNHRIALYNLDCEPLGYFGTVGRGPGELRYPYDLALLPDGTLVVCEFGNNRLQLFSPDGRTVAVYGCAGHQLGQLAYPWGVAVDGRRRAFIVDAGNNRIQVWQL